MSLCVQNVYARWSTRRGLRDIISKIMSCFHYQHHCCVAAGVRTKTDAWAWLHEDRCVGVADKGEAV